MNLDSLPELELQLEQLMPLIRERLSSGSSVRFMPRGVSMLPMLRQGVDSVVLSSAPQKLKKYDLPLYQRSNGTYILHRIIKGGDSYTCMGDNQYVAEPGLQHDQIIALVTAFYRGERKYSVTHPGYWLYCRVWHYSRPVRHFWCRGKRWLKRHMEGKK